MEAEPACWRARSLAATVARREMLNWLPRRWRPDTWPSVNCVFLVLRIGSHAVVCAQIQLGCGRREGPSRACSWSVAPIGHLSPPADAPSDVWRSGLLPRCYPKFLKSGRGDWIRTSDPLRPSRTYMIAGPRPTAILLSVCSASAADWSRFFRSVTAAVAIRCKLAWCASNRAIASC